MVTFDERGGDRDRDRGGDRDRERDEDRAYAGYDPENAEGDGRRGGPRRNEKCRFCRSKFPPDYKDVDMLSRLVTGQGKMYARKRSGNCAYHQRMFALAVKQARFLALVSYTG